MRIINEGNFDLARWTLNFECKQCGCEFEASSDEYSEEREHNRIHGWVTTQKCKCPCCGIQVSR